ncbi:MAG: hypothetical protein K0V04_00540 [Deltaproteobacteria bacterium]|nr:hypothetical protein [Deltaproteobacteria bacterium]
MLHHRKSPSSGTWAHAAGRRVDVSAVSSACVRAAALGAASALLLAAGCDSVPAGATADTVGASSRRAGGATPCPRVEFTCLDNVDEVVFPEEDQAKVDTLYAELLLYLRAYHDVLSRQVDGCSTSIATVATASVEDGQISGKQERCLDQYSDVVEMLRHIELVLDNEQAAKKCFDPTMSTVPEAFRGFTPSEGLRDGSDVARWLDRPLFTDRSALQDFGAGFATALRNTSGSGPWSHDPTIAALPNLWASAGWVPLYLDREDAGSQAFRGGYAYAEFMGPLGMLKIDAIDGERFQGEIGVTNQRTGTFYPAHYHHAQELYITLSESACEDHYASMLIDAGISEIAQATDWSDYFIPTDSGDQWPLYIDRNKVHSFEVGDCNGSAAEKGMVTAWARTVVRDGEDQGTNICAWPDGAGPDDLAPSSQFSCDSP